MRIIYRARCLLLVLGLGAGMHGAASAFTLSLSSANFTLAPSFNSVTAFDFEIDVSAPLAPGVYDNPMLGGVRYSVLGVLGDPTPSGFPGFNLQRTITNADFYAQGSSLQFAIAPGANLADGLQLSELTSLNGPVFIFNGREEGTGRYHPPLLELFGDGSGQIQNANNMGGINPSTQQVVDVNFGDEYIVALSSNPATMTLAVPEPSAAWMLLAGLVGVGMWCRRRQAPTARNRAAA